jgi:hypothetical protein
VEAWMLQQYQWWLGGIRTTAALLISSVKTQQILVQFYTDGQTKEIKNIGTFTDDNSEFRNVTNGVEAAHENKSNT